jgi:hypothetical protein
MEALNMPSREIRRRFTKSDIAVMSWRSAEVSANMRDRTLRTPRLPSKMDGSGYPLESEAYQKQLDAIEARLGGIVYKMTDDKGEIDLRRLTGDEAVTYMQALGVPVIPLR